MIETTECLLNYRVAHAMFADTMSKFADIGLESKPCDVAGCNKVCTFPRVSNGEREVVVPTYSDDPCKELEQVEE